MLSLRPLVVAAALLAVGAPTPSRAETFQPDTFTPPVCSPWWEPSPVDLAPTTPITPRSPVLLGVRWSSSDASTFPADSPVVVTNAAGHAVGGLVSLGERVGPSDFATVLAGELVWSARGELPAGDYQVVVDVPEPPSEPGCPSAFHAFLHVFSFTVTDAPETASPTIRVAPTLTRTWGAIAYDTDCAARPAVAACPDEPGVCCFPAHPEFQSATLDAAVTVDALPPGGPSYALIRVSDDTSGDPATLVYPVPVGEPAHVPRYVSGSSAAGPLPPVHLTTRLHGLVANGGIVASAEVDVPWSLGPDPAPPVCEFQRCAAARPAPTTAADAGCRGGGERGVPGVVGLLLALTLLRTRSSRRRPAATR
ncbi:MAG: hypothetical protein H6745_00955 [Deltaproteobacteria bacterium]|nr:hypothetical protein [Deltaproteobacteria bacterium]